MEARVKQLRYSSNNISIQILSQNQMCPLVARSSVHVAGRCGDLTNPTRARPSSIPGFSPFRHHHPPLRRRRRRAQEGSEGEEGFSPPLKLAVHVWCQNISNPNSCSVAYLLAESSWLNESLER